MFRKTRNSSWPKPILHTTIAYIFSSLSSQRCLTWPEKPRPSSLPTTQGSLPECPPSIRLITFGNPNGHKPPPGVQEAWRAEKLPNLGLTAGSLEEPFYFCGLDLSKWSLTISIMLGVLSPVTEPGGVTPFLRVLPVPVPSSGPPPLSLRSLEQSLLAWWSNPAS